MFFCNIKEIEAIYPQSKWTNLDRLISDIDNEVNVRLTPLLGDALLDKLATEYDSLVENLQDTGLTNATFNNRDLNIRILLQCQRIALYYTLADNAGVYALSFNEGGGFNQMSADYYESAEQKALDRFERDAWRKARQSEDNLLTLLELDAESKEPLYQTEWKESEFFYYKADLLFTTAHELRNYTTLKDGRKQFIEMFPNLQEAQSVYLEPAIGEELFSAFVHEWHDGDNGSDGNDGEDAASQVEHYIWRKKAKNYLRRALVRYAESLSGEGRKDSVERGDMQLALAKRCIVAHQDCFRPYVKTSPLYVPAPPTFHDDDGLWYDEDGNALPEEEQKRLNRQQQCPKHCPPSNDYDPKNPCNSVFAPFVKGVRRF